jgi:Flp pilus assembly protein TadG
MLKGARINLKSGRDAGAVAIEFAFLIALLPLPFLAFGIVDYGEFMGQATNLAAVVRGAAEYARGQIVRGNAVPTVANLSTVTGLPAAVFNPPATSFCTCADNTSVTCPGAGDPNPCTGVPGGDTRVLTYVAVSGTQTYTPLVSGTWSFPASVVARTVFRSQ